VAPSLRTRSGKSHDGTRRTGSAEPDQRREDLFRQTAADTDGELLAIELVLAPGGAVSGTHVHPEQEERFEVVSGTMGFRLGPKKVIAGPGETVVALAEEGRCLRSGMPKPLDLAMFVREFAARGARRSRRRSPCAPRWRRSRGWPSVAAARCSRPTPSPTGPRVGVLPGSS
jgi:mannose-6-phosphate isomerase-like protein (cupin superfamily)